MIGPLITMQTQIYKMGILMFLVGMIVLLALTSIAVASSIGIGYLINYLVPDIPLDSAVIVGSICLYTAVFIFKKVPGGNLEYYGEDHEDA